MLEIKETWMNKPLQLFPFKYDPGLISCVIESDISLIWTFPDSRKQYSCPSTKKPTIC